MKLSWTGPRVKVEPMICFPWIKPAWLGWAGRVEAAGSRREARPGPGFNGGGAVGERAADAASENFRRHTGKGKGKQQGEGKGKGRRERKIKLRGEEKRERVQNFCCDRGRWRRRGARGAPQGHALLAARGSLSCPGIRWQA